MMVSIIIPVYNAEQWLNECLESIAQQSFTDFEVLQIDDGSCDRSATICKQFVERDKRFHYYYQDNAGVSVARNNGLSLARGEWISFVDSDDKVDKDFLSTRLKYANSYDAIWCGYSTRESCLGRKGGLSAFSKEILIKDIVFERGKKPQLWSLLYRKRIIDSHNLQFTPGCVRNEDYEFFMKYLAFCEKKIARTGYIGYYYRQNPQSVMHQRRSLQSVLMSIEASSNVGETLEQVGVIPDKTWLTAFAVTRCLYLMSKEKNIDGYDILHSRFPVFSYIKMSLKKGSMRSRCAALLYTLLGQKCFYDLFSSI